TACGQTTLDAFAADCGLTRLELVKIDTDGHEFAVLSGAVKCIERFRPVVLFEACEYLMTAPGATYADFEKFFERIGYTISLGINRGRLSAAEFHDKCPTGGSLDLIAVANEQNVL
ncbi:MAG: FkbM family methyltransferase, partial [Nevskiales bacterium]